MVQLIISKIKNLYFQMKNSFKHHIFLLKQCDKVNYGKNNTKRPFLEDCGSPSAIKRPEMVQLISSKIQI